MATYGFLRTSTGGCKATGRSRVSDIRLPGETLWRTGPILNAECTDFATAEEIVLRDDNGLVQTWAIRGRSYWITTECWSFTI